MPVPRVSVVMPVYNVENYLRPCIESAIHQTLEDIEIIIVDDGSTDSSKAIIDYYADQDDRIKAVHKDNEGYGKACNVGFDMARGEYVAILESDDFIDPEMYEELYSYAKRLDADVVKAPYKDCFLKDVIKPYPHNDYLSRNMPRERLYSLKTCACQLATHQSIWSGLYRRSYLTENAIRFDEVPGAGHVDIKFCVESLVYSRKLAWLDKPFYNYRVEREGSSTANYQLLENATRYREMHDFFKSFADEFRMAAPQLVAREAVGCYRYFKKQPFTDDEFCVLRSLFLDFSDDEILRAPIIKQSDKQEILQLRNDPKAAYALLATAGNGGKKRDVTKIPEKKPQVDKKDSPKKKAGSASANAVKPSVSKPSGEGSAATWAYRLAVANGLAACFLALKGGRDKSVPLEVATSVVGAVSIGSVCVYSALFLRKTAKKLGRKSQKMLAGKLRAMRESKDSENKVS